MNQKMAPITLRNLNPHFPPWCWISSFELSAMTDRSLVTLRNWRLRGTGPAWSRDQKGKIWYRLADVLSWASGGQQSADEAIDNYLTTVPGFGGLSKERAIELLSRHARPLPKLVHPLWKFSKSTSPIRMETT